MSNVRVAFVVKEPKKWPQEIIHIVLGWPQEKVSLCGGKWVRGGDPKTAVLTVDKWCSRCMKKYKDRYLSDIDNLLRLF